METNLNEILIKKSRKIYRFHIVYLSILIILILASIMWVFFSQSQNPDMAGFVLVLGTWAIIFFSPFTSILEIILGVSGINVFKKLRLNGQKNKKLLISSVVLLILGLIFPISLILNIIF